MFYIHTEMEMPILHKANFNTQQSTGPEVKICSRVSLVKALPLILEIAQEFWP